MYFTSSGARNVVRAPSLIKCGVQSEGGHRAVVLQGSEGCGRTTALRRFVRLVAAYCEGDDSSPLVVARRVSWPGRTAVDLLCDVVAQLSEVVNVADAPSDDEFGGAAFVGNQHVDLDSLVKSYSNLLRAFSQSSPARLVVALDGLENVRRGGTVNGGDINWLALPLPMRVHVVATFLSGPESDAHSPLDVAVGGRTVRVIDLEGLSESAVSQVVADACRRRRRRPPVDGRLSAIMQLVGSKPRPAYVTLLADEFASRSAAAPAASSQLENPVERLKNIEKIAKARFKRAERIYGK